MDITNLDAIEFFLDGKKHIRLYYQTADRFLRESSFEAGEGWFVRQNGVLAPNAKKNTPITATRWVSGNTVHIRVYFLDESQHICECVGEHTSKGTIWISITPNHIQVDQPLKVASGSQLAIARPDKDGETLRLFYQQEQNGDKCLREVNFESEVDSDDESTNNPGTGSWRLKDLEIHEAAEDSRIAAVSAAKTGIVRVYYEGRDKLLRVNLWKAEERVWTGSIVVDKQFNLVPKAPITAVCWYVNGADMRDLRIRIFTILKSDSAGVTR